MSENEAWQSIVSVILLHPVRRQIIVCQEGEQWALPRIQIAQKWITPISSINAEMQRLFALQTTVLRQVDDREEESTHRVYVTHLLEVHHPSDVLPTGLQWLGIDELDALTFSDPQQQAAVATCLGEIVAGIIPALRVPWSQPGWQANTEEWIRTQMEQLGDPVLGPIEQIKIWFLSCVLRAATARGSVYFKVTHATALMVNEATVTQALAQMFPECMPRPLCIDPERGWMLLADFGKPVGWDAPIAVRVAVLRDFARLQIAAATKIDQLLAMGCINRCLSKLAEQIDPLFADAEIIASVSPEIQQQILAVAPTLKALCRQLEQYHVPATLVHGDMHMNNVARRSAGQIANDPEVLPESGQSIFFDWTDACLAHPFLDLIDLLYVSDVAIQTLLRDAYLTPWLGYEPMERLVEMWQIAAPLCALHQAISYRHIILANERADCKQALDWAMPFWFGKILESLA